MADSNKLQHFVGEMTRLVNSGVEETQLLASAREAMHKLVAEDDWLPDELAKPHPQHYQQYLLHRDPEGRFSVVSFVWGPGQRTPVHDHTVWGVIGMLRGAEVAVSYAYDGQRLVQREEIQLQPGDVEVVGPAIGDIHRVSNAHDDRVSISVHCYGGDIGQVRRHVYDLDSGALKEFVSGYANA